MNQYVDGVKSLVAGEALVKYRRVGLDGSQQAVYVDAGVEAIGVTMENAASGAMVAVKLFNNSGTFLVETAGAVTAGAKVYGAVDGKIDDTVSGDPIGLALEAATGSAQYIEIVLSTDKDSRILNDANGNEVITLAGTTSAVNEITVTNAATGSGPSIAATGGDTNIPVTVAQKGAADIILGAATGTGIKLAATQPLKDANGNELIKFSATTSAVNEVTITNAATSGVPSIAATGGDTNIAIDLKTKGTGLGALVGASTDCLTWQMDGAAKLGFFGKTPAARQAHLADASTAHNLNATFSDVGVEGALNTLGTKINSIISKLETLGLLATA